MKWEVEIVGDKFDLKELSKTLVDDELRIREENGRYLLESTRFENLNNPEEVSSLAVGILEILTGSTRLSIGGRTPIHVANTAKIGSDGVRYAYLRVTDFINARDTITNIEITKEDGTKKLIHSTHSVPGWIKLGLTNQNVAKALRLYGSDEHNWVSLYRIYEVIEEDVGGLDKIINNGWATKSSIKRFKHTANSPSTVGDDSRHGKESSTPPSNPMDIGEARALVEFMLHNWLKSKI